MYCLQLLDLLFFVKCLKNPSDLCNVFNHVTFHSGSTRSSSNPKNSEIRSNSLQRPKGSSPCMAVVRRFDCSCYSIIRKGEEKTDDLSVFHPDILARGGKIEF